MTVTYLIKIINSLAIRATQSGSIPGETKEQDVLKSIFQSGHHSVEERTKVRTSEIVVEGSQTSPQTTFDRVSKIQPFLEDLLPIIEGTVYGKVQISCLVSGLEACLI
jgi:hypothetical protein